jgi:hypothetical protein
MFYPFIPAKYTSLDQNKWLKRLCIKNMMLRGCLCI